MKIKNVSCTQFAGVRDRSVSFEDGINVIYGKNESGKSTLVNLVSRTLFQNARLDGRSDKEFRELYFPALRRGSNITGDFADGKVWFETEKGVYTLSKEWGVDSRCALSSPDGIIRDKSTIDAILKEALVYGEGVYSDMLFSSQRNTDFSLKTILDATKKTDAKKEITEVLSRAFNESDGISIDAVEQAIDAQIDSIAGKHWDFERNIPVRKAGRWSTGLGELLKAYYELEDKNAVLDEILNLEREADKANSDYLKKDLMLKEAEEEFNKFSSFANKLIIRNENKKTVERVEKELLKIKEVLVSWPKAIESLEKARALQAEKNNREIIDKYESAKKLEEKIKEYSDEGEKLNVPQEDEILNVKESQKSMSVLENKLCGMNLNAAIKMLGDNRVEVRLLRTGELVEISENLSITEAVSITVGNVLQIKLTPADVDVNEITSKIDECKKNINSVFEKYGVNSLEELESLTRKMSEIKAKRENTTTHMKLILGGVAFESLEQEFNNIQGEVRDKEIIDKEISEVCLIADAGRFIAAKEAVTEGYARDYTSIESLNERMLCAKKELEKATKAVEEASLVPEEYLAIGDIEGHLEKLQSILKLNQELREAALTAKTSAVSRLESYKENISGDPMEEAEKARELFEEQKALLKHWQNIKAVFLKQKETMTHNPLTDLAEKFEKYLGIISGGRISSELPQRDKLNVTVYSDERMLDYTTLSEGTKETVSLSFRLAVLEHLFPQGGGVIVLDDPFSDMDNDRAARSCELLKECALRHQVIFLTCREEYVEMLNGNIIRF